MHRGRPRRALIALLSLFFWGASFAPGPQADAREVDRPNTPVVVPPPAWMKDGSAALERGLLARYGQTQAARIRRGLGQVAQFWRAEDGGQAAFEEFIRANFAGDQATVDTLFGRWEHLLEQLDGHMHEINREFRQQMDLDIGLVLPFDEAFGGYDPSAHILDDFFQNKLALVVLLNFPLTPLDDRLERGAGNGRRSA